jgi:hypothetical protein
MFHNPQHYQVRRRRERGRSSQFNFHNSKSYFQTQNLISKLKILFPNSKSYFHINIIRSGAADAEIERLKKEVEDAEAQNTGYEEALYIRFETDELGLLKRELERVRD